VARLRTPHELRAGRALPRPLTQLEPYP
jgi:hypothetical protein